MDVFTDEEFNVFCEELEKELENLEKIGNLSPEERQILQTACTEKNN